MDGRNPELITDRIIINPPIQPHHPRLFPAKNTENKGFSNTKKSTFHDPLPMPFFIVPTGPHKNPPSIWGRRALLIGGGVLIQTYPLIILVILFFYARGTPHLG